MRLKKPRHIQFQLDIPAIIADYARRYVDSYHQHQSLEEYAAQAASDLQMRDAKKWVVLAVEKLQGKEVACDRHRSDRKIVETIRSSNGFLHQITHCSICGIRMSRPVPAGQEVAA